MKRLLSLCVLGLATAGLLYGPVAGGSPKQSGTIYNGAVILNCAFDHAASDDPIIYPGQPGASHHHSFFGAVGVNAATKTRTLLAGGTTCEVKQDRAAYWIPTVIGANGQPVLPLTSSFYYRNNSNVKALAFPTGFRFVSGNPHNTVVTQAAGVWRCASAAPAYATRTIPTSCLNQTGGKLGENIQMTMFLNACWDGDRYGNEPGQTAPSAHVAPMPAGTGNVCGGAYPVNLPQLQFVINYPGAVAGGRLASDHAGAAAGTSMHGDFWNGWEPKAIADVTELCLNVSGTPGVLTCQKSGSRIIRASDGAVIVG